MHSNKQPIKKGLEILLTLGADKRATLVIVAALPKAGTAICFSVFENQ